MGASESKGSSNDTIDIQDEKCLTHEQYNTELYCISHKQTCCAYCAFDNHKQCEVKELNDVNEDILYGTQANDYMRRLRNSQLELDKISQRVDGILKEAQGSREKCRIRSRDYRKELTERLDSLQQSIDADIDKKHRIPFDETFTTTLKKTVADKIEELQTYRVKSLRGRMFIGLQTLGDEIDTIANKLVTFKSTLSVQTYDFVADRRLRSSLFQHVSSFGELQESVTGSEEYHSAVSDVSKICLIVCRYRYISVMYCVGLRLISNLLHYGYFYVSLDKHAITTVVNVVYLELV